MNEESDASNGAPIPFGRYRLVKELGAGGMAVVWRAVLDGPRGFERDIVIKRMQRELAKDPSFVHMLATEARLSARLRHPSIVQVYEFGEVDGEYYLAMELVDGTDLSWLLRTCALQRRRPPIPVICFIVREVANALAYAHSLTDAQERPLQIVHRDVSPSNIMITHFGAVKLLDFGIAKAADYARHEQTPTQAGGLRGKITYLSPEQADGRPLDGRSDMFSLGIVFHELLTMQRLFRGSPNFEVLRHIREAKVQAPGELVDGIPSEVDAVVMRMLAQRPERRFQSCAELAEALTPVVRRLGGDSASLRAFLDELGRPQEVGEQPSGRTSVLRSNVGTLASKPNPLSPRRTTTSVVSRAVRNRSILWISGVLGLAALAAAQLGRASRKQLPPVSAHATLAAGAPATPPAPTHVRLSVAGPDGAAVTIDGSAVGIIPVGVSLPVRADTRRVEVRLDGYAPWVTDVRGDGDVALVATPTPLRVANVRPRRFPSLAHAAVAESAHASAAGELKALHAAAEAKAAHADDARAAHPAAAEAKPADTTDGKAAAHADPKAPAGKHPNSHAFIRNPFQ